MVPLSELRALPIEERLRLVGDLWDSIAEDQGSLPDDPAVIKELRTRKVGFEANPDSGIPWETAKAKIRSGRG